MIFPNIYTSAKLYNLPCYWARSDIQQIALILSVQFDTLNVYTSIKIPI